MILESVVQLPEHIEPMLARTGEPFDSEEHLFELKWDGVRAISYVDAGGLRMHGRRRRDLASRYPELAALAGLPAGTVLDGELVVLREDGRPDFRAIVGRENASPARAQAAAARHPVAYVVFDLLYAAGESLLAQPLRQRREQLTALVEREQPARVLVSDAVVGQGLHLFEAARAQELEGIVAKRLDSPYQAGQRSDAWQKIKPVRSVHCLVLGYEPEGEQGFKSLIIASDFDGELACVGKVGSGIAESDRRELQQLLRTHAADGPLVEAGLATSGASQQAKWLRPGIYCTVSYFERTASGNLRAPVYKGLVAGDAP